MSKRKKKLTVKIKNKKAAKNSYVDGKRKRKMN